MKEDHGFHAKSCAVMAVIAAVTAGLNFLLSARRKDPMFSLLGTFWVGICTVWTVLAVRRTPQEEINTRK